MLMGKDLDRLHGFGDYLKNHPTNIISDLDRLHLKPIFPYCFQLTCNYAHATETISHQGVPAIPQRECTILY